MEVKEYSPGVPDWSTVDKPTGALFPPVQESSELKKFLFTPEQEEQFWRDGFLLNIPVLTEEECDKLLEDYAYFTGEKTHPGMDMLYEYHSNQTGDPQNVLMHCLGHWRLTQNFHDLIYHPRVVVPASRLLVQDASVKVRFWHDQLFAKPPRHGGNVAWHQDYSYWTRTVPMMHLTVHIALDDQTEENGALHYIPGSHRWNRNGFPLPVTDFNFADMDSIQTILTQEEKDAFKPVCGKLKKGQASFHHAMSVHGSYGNRSDVPRRAAVLNYFADGVRYESGVNTYAIGSPLKGVNIKKGEKMEGQFFPVVFDPDCLI